MSSFCVVGSCVFLGELCNLSVNGTLSRAGWASWWFLGLEGVTVGLLFSWAVARVGDGNAGGLRRRRKLLVRCPLTHCFITLSDEGSCIYGPR